MGWSHVVSAGVGLICLVIAAVLWFVVGIGGGHSGGGEKGGKGHSAGKGWRHQLPRVVVLLVLTGVTGLLGTPLGRLLHRIVSWLDSLTGRATGAWTGAVVLGIVGFVTAVVVIVHLHAGKAKVRTLVAAALLPVAVVTIPGPLGSLFASGTSMVTGAVGWGVGAMFGLGG